MANVESDNNFHDIGFLKSKKCFNIQGIKVCEFKFDNGRFTISDKELKKLCKMK